VESEVRTVNPNQFGLIAQFELRGESLTQSSARLTTKIGDSHWWNLLKNKGFK